MSPLNPIRLLNRPRIPAQGLPFFLIGLVLFLCSTPGRLFPSTDKLVKLGNEIFLNKLAPTLKGKSLGLVINHTSALPSGKSLVQALLEKGHNIQAIFSPEHGVTGTVEAGKEVKNSEFKSITIYSLYEETKKPTPEQMEGIDLIIYDIQDVGARFYTYITTLKYVLEAAAKAQIPVYVLDRPNPVGGEIVEGPLMIPEFESFIGALPIPIRYGLTSGELAMMIKGEKWIPQDFDLHVVRMRNWKRHFYWKDTGLPWTPTSPNMPSPETAIIYPGSVFLSAIQLNEGVGTPHPFLQFGAPWLKPLSLMNRLNGGQDFGVEFEAIAYTPRSLPGKVLHPIYENRTCQGIRITITQKEKFSPIRFALETIKALQEEWPDNIFFSAFKLNRIFGNELLSRFLEGNVSYETLLSRMEEEEEIFKQKRKKYLLYE
jgi:uncharacterized protein YbbC (DUF1343 family)